MVITSSYDVIITWLWCRLFNTAMNMYGKIDDCRNRNCTFLLCERYWIVIMITAAGKSMIHRLWLFNGTLGPTERVFMKVSSFSILIFVPECNLQFHHEHLLFVLGFEVIFRRTSPKKHAGLCFYIDRFQDLRQIWSEIFISMRSPNWWLLDCAF